MMTSGARAVTTTQKKTVPLETTHKVVLTEEGSIWGISLEASCYLVGSAPAPRVLATLTMSGKRVDKVIEFKAELMEEDWREFVSDAVSACSTSLSDRGVVVPDQFREDLSVTFSESRTQAIMSVVRHQAATLIRELSSAEACRIWSEEEARHIFES
jgi:hypothetical protein